MRYAILCSVMAPRGPLAVRRMTAHWVVLAAAALTTLVAAAVGAALAVFAGQGLPQAVRHDLSAAPGTSLSAQVTLVDGRLAPVTAALRDSIGTAIQGVPFGFWQATWSDPLSLVPGALPAPPAGAGKGNTPVLQAAALEGVTGRAVLLSGRWPAAGAALRRRRRRCIRRGPRRCRPPCPLPPPRCCTCPSATCSGCVTVSLARP